MEGAEAEKGAMDNQEVPEVGRQELSCDELSPAT